MKRSAALTVIMALALGALLSLGSPVLAEAQVFPLFFEGGSGLSPSQVA
ncbi:MAG: hypothetical protein M5R38_14420 [Candidatus Methylomirabilis sp.]|nr:hypothetical protein [Candidatus Methylomirabilis sp.]